MHKVKFEKRERTLPFDSTIKITLLYLHYIGFSVWYGGLVIGTEYSTVFCFTAIISGLLLMVRELYKDGFVWFFNTEGLLTIFKVMLLVLIRVLLRYEELFLSIIILCGILGSHLPKRIKNWRII